MAEALLCIAIAVVIAGQIAALTLFAILVWEAWKESK